MANFLITSPETPNYNCVAWAAEEDSRWWWPDTMGDYYWPTQVPRDNTVEAYLGAFRTLGYEPCDNVILEMGFKKIAIYVGDDGKPTHIARQLNNGNWTSKLGSSIDVEHDFFPKWSDAMIGLSYYRLSDYGKIGAILKKPI